MKPTSWTYLITNKEANPEHFDVTIGCLKTSNPVNDINDLVPPGSIVKGVIKGGQDVYDFIYRVASQQHIVDIEDPDEANWVAFQAISKIFAAVGYIKGGESHYKNHENYISHILNSVSFDNHVVVKKEPQRVGMPKSLEREYLDWASDPRGYRSELPIV